MAIQMRTSFYLLLPLLLASCTGDYVKTSFVATPGAEVKANEKAASESTAVQVFEAPPAKPYKVVGQVRADGELSNRDEEFLVRLKLEAAKVGANGIIIQDHTQTSIWDVLTFGKPKYATALAISMDAPQQKPGEKPGGSD